MRHGPPSSRFIRFNKSSIFVLLRPPSSGWPLSFVHHTVGLESAFWSLWWSTSKLKPVSLNLWHRPPMIRSSVSSSSGNSEFYFRHRRSSQNYPISDIDIKKTQTTTSLGVFTHLFGTSPWHIIASGDHACIQVDQWYHTTRAVVCWIHLTTTRTVGFFL